MSILSHYFIYRCELDLFTAHLILFHRKSPIQSIPDELNMFQENPKLISGNTGNQNSIWIRCFAFSSTIMFWPMYSASFPLQPTVYCNWKQKCSTFCPLPTNCAFMCRLTTRNRDSQTVRNLCGSPPISIHPYLSYTTSQGFL